ncbi:hypothetical protein [Amycolatopsis kentuckyensis]|uniref:hypothetical protein n=1 Tax=Amycolatopsis kentuckyensis TaxID=218823 RepID=UPI000A39A7AC|nr:hypothetical protein [Amycolatopsis kentuckyensis]
MAALSSHYAATWDLEAARIRGEKDEIDAALTASMATRDVITRPRAQFAVLAPQLRPQIAFAEEWLERLSSKPRARSPEQLTARRLAAKTALRELETAMAAVMGNLGAGLPAHRRTVTVR